MPKAFDLSVNLKIQEIIGLEAVKKAVAGINNSGATELEVKVNKASTQAVSDMGTAVANVNQTMTKSKESAKQAKDGMDNVAKSAKQAANASANFGDAMYIAARRYAAFVISTTGAFVVADQIKQATASVIEFDLSLTRLDQTLDGPKAQLESLKNQMLELSVQTATSLKDLGATSVTLAQAGYSAQDLTKMLDQLAKVPLLPSFDGIEQATEGVIAIMNQFKLSTSDTADILDKLNNVANKYAVTSADLIDSVRRGGGTWASVNGTLDEYLALTTAVIQTTRESAESVGTAFKTITGRLARPKTLGYLESIGVQTKDAEGNFVGMFETLRQTAKQFETASPLKKLEIAEELGGARQIGKMVAALGNWDLVQKVLNDSLTSYNSVQEDASKGMKSLNYQIEQLKASFNALYVSMSGQVFAPVIKSLVDVGHGIKYVVEMLGPAIPLIGAFVTAWAGVKAINVGSMLAAKLSPALGGMGMGGGPGLLSKFDTMMAAGYTAVAANPFKARQGTTTLDEFGGTVTKGAGPSIAKSAISNPSVQFGLLVALDLLVPKLTEFANTTLGANKAVTDWVATFIKTGSLLVGVMSLLRNQSIGKTLSTGVFGREGMGVGKTLAIAGITAVAVGASAYASAIDKAAEERFQRIADELGKIDYDPKKGGLKDISDVIDKNFNATYGNVIKTFNDRYNIMYAGGKKINKLFSGDFSGFMNTKLVEPQEIKKMFTDMLKINPEQTRNMLMGAMKAYGDNWQTVMESSVANEASARGDANPQNVARTFMLAMQEAVGGAKGVSTLWNQVQVEMEQTLRDAANKKIREHLGDILTPPELLSSLRKFADSLDQVSNATAASVQSFDALSSTIEGISAISLPTDFAPKAIEQLTTKTPAFDIAFNAAPEMKTSIATIEGMFQATQDFADAVQKRMATQRDFAEKGVPIEDTLANGKFVDQNKFGQGLPQTAQDSLNGYFKQTLIPAIINGFNANAQFITPEALRKGFDEYYKALRDAEKSMFDQLVRGAQQTLANAQFRIKKQAYVLQAEAKTGVTGVGAISLMNKSLGRVGIQAPSGPSDVINSSALMKQLTDARLQNERQLIDAQKALAAAMAGSATKTFPELVASVEKLQMKGNELAAAEGALTNAYPALLEKLRIRSEERMNNLQRLPMQVPGAYSAPVEGRSFAYGKNIDVDRMNQLSRIKIMQELRDNTKSPQIQSELDTRIQTAKQGVQQYDNRVSSLNKMQSDYAAGAISPERYREMIAEMEAEKFKAEEKIRMEEWAANKEIQQRQQEAADAMAVAAKTIADAMPSFADPMNIFSSSVKTFQEAVQLMTSSNYMGVRTNPTGLSPTQNSNAPTTQAAPGSTADVAGALKGVTDSFLSGNTLLSEKIQQLVDQLTNFESVFAPLTDVSNSADNLSEVLSQTTDAVVAGMKLQVDATQNFNIDVTGLNEAVQSEVRPLLEAAAKQAAQSVVQQVLYKLGKATSNAEEARPFNEVATGMA